MGYIYLITNTANGKRYVGQTQQVDIETRWRNHRNLDKHCIGRYLLNAYNKHGIDKFKFQIICVCFDEDCNQFETDYIKKYNCLVPNGYNLMSGGGNFKHHPETIKKMSESLKGRRTVVLSEESRKKLSESLKGEKNPNFGKKMSEEQKKKISETKKKAIEEGRITYKKIYEISEKQKEALKNGQAAIKKLVGQYDLDGKLLNIYESITEASKVVKIDGSMISKVCSGVKRYKTAAGFVWKYLPKDDPML